MASSASDELASIGREANELLWFGRHPFDVEAKIPILFRSIKSCSAIGKSPRVSPRREGEGGNVAYACKSGQQEMSRNAHALILWVSGTEIQWTVRLGNEFQTESGIHGSP